VKISRRAAEKRGERERQVGLEPDDEAAKWLAENDAAPAPGAPKALRKSKALHQWRRQQQQRDQ
jgi:hypothetical protein